MRGLILHLHAFASEVKLTEAEWTTAIAILTATGRITSEKRSVFICGPTRSACRCSSTRSPIPP